MKKTLQVLFGILCSVISVNSVFSWNAKDFETDAILRLYNNGLTKYNSSQDFNGDTNFTREQAAKFFSQFAINVMNKKTDTSKTCIFKDINTADITLKPDIITACHLGIFQGSNGYFFPKKDISITEAVAVLIRINDGLLDETVKPWYSNYINKAVDANIIPYDTQYMPKRIQIASMLYAYANPNILPVKKIYTTKLYNLTYPGDITIKDEYEDGTCISFDNISNDKGASVQIRDNKNIQYPCGRSGVGYYPENYSEMIEINSNSIKTSGIKELFSKGGIFLNASLGANLTDDISFSYNYGYFGDNEELAQKEEDSYIKKVIILGILSTLQTK